MTNESTARRKLARIGRPWMLVAMVCVAGCAATLPQARKAPEVMVDANQLAAGHPFFDYAPGAVSDDGQLLAYSTDVTGNRQYVLQIKDLRSGAVLADQMQLVDAFAWAADNKTLYYVKEDE